MVPQDSPTGSLPPEYIRALELQRAGNTADAEAYLRQALDKYPRDAQLRYALSAMLIQGQRLEEAEKVLRGAVRVQPSHADSWYALGFVLTCLRRVEEALPAFVQAVRLRPDFFEALTGIGEAMIAQGKWREAERRFAAALEIRPEYTRARHGLAFALMRMKRHHESLAMTKDILRHTPCDTVAQRLAHNTLIAMRDYAGAVMLFEDITRTCPQSGSAWLSLGHFLTLMGRYGEAEAACGKSLELLPNNSAAYLDMAMSLLGSGRFAEADGQIEKSMACARDNPRELEALLYLFISAELKGAAEPLCRRILALDPTSRVARNQLLLALELLGHRGEAASMRKRAMEVFDPETYTILICAATMHQSETPQALLEYARAYGRDILPESARKSAARRTFGNQGASGGRIRIGFVSHEVYDHSVAAFLEPVIARLNRDEFEVYLYSTCPVVDEVSKRLMAGADRFADLFALTPEEQTHCLRKDKIDIAIDTTGYTTGCHLESFAHRAAPVQAHYIGYFGTSGLERMDYFLGDQMINLPENDRFFTEKVWRLPCFWTAWQEKIPAPDIRWTPDADGIITLGSCNALYKLGPQCLDLWGEIMRRLPGSRLVLKSWECADPFLRANILKTLERKGIAAGRIAFMLNISGWREHMAFYDRIDLALDPMPFNGCTTAFEALWMGVPMIALEGGWMGGRVGMAMLRALGHPEWVAATEEEYIAKAVALAEDVDLRRALRVPQREKMRASPLCDYDGVTRALEDAFRHMHSGA